MTSPTKILEQPPTQGTPITSPLWPRFLWNVYTMLAKGGQSTFGKTQIFDATFTNENAFQDLLNVNKGIYSTYSSTNNNILYGFACNVKRAAGANFVVAAQLNAWAERGVTCPVYGLAVTALNQPGSVNCALTAIEPDVVQQENANTTGTTGIFNVFKNRFDGIAAVVEGLGANRYNYTATGFSFGSQGRSTATEYCGWNVGISFPDYWGDQDNPPAWAIGTTYQGGQTVTSGGVVWKAIVGNVGNLPAGGSVFWVQRTYAGTNNLAVGIDFSTMSVGSMARMASAIRLRNTQYIHWEETGAVGTRMNGAAGEWQIDNQGGFRFGVDVATGVLRIGNAAVALGGGAAPALGTIGGAGPAAAAQAKWIYLKDATGAGYFIPAWV